MTRSHRPLSPHLQIYRLPLTVLLSIMHRISGVGLSLGLVLLTYWLLAAAAGADAYTQAQGLCGSWFGLLILFGFTVALFFHLSNGVRHLFWDCGVGINKRAAARSARWVLLATGGLTVLTWGLGLLCGGSA